MQTPKARSNSLEVPRKTSPRAASSEAPHRNSPRATPPGVPQKVSPRVARQLKTTGLESESSSSPNQATSTPKDRSSKVIERRSPKSPVPEKKRPSRVSELENQISQLQDELKKVKDQLSSSESWKKQSQLEGDELQNQLSLMSSKLKECHDQLLGRSASKEAHEIEVTDISQEHDQAWVSVLEDIQKQHSIKSAELASTLNEIEQLKAQLEMVADSEASTKTKIEVVNPELLTLKENLAETLLVVDEMKNQLRDCKESEAMAQAVADETLLQLETAKKAVEALRLDGAEALDAYNAIVLELDQSKARINLLEGLVNNLTVDIGSVGCHDTEIEIPGGDQKFDYEVREVKTKKLTKLELTSTNLEVEQLRSELERAEMRYQEEQIQSTVQIRNAYDLVDQMKTTFSQREGELQLEILKLKADIEELKANLMDKETELQGICEENEDLIMRLENSMSSQSEYELEKELKKSKELLKSLKADLMDKETTVQNISEENEMLKLEMKKKDANRGNMSDELVAELEVARATEQDARIKLGCMKEEAERISKREARVSEQLEAVQAANSEMEAELRRLTVQSDQWRKAAEAAASMLSVGNNGKIIERTGSMDSHFSPVMGTSPCALDVDNDFLKKKNGNMLKRIGVLWKKPQK